MRLALTGRQVGQKPTLRYLCYLLFKPERLGVRSYKHAAPTELVVFWRSDSYKHAAPTELVVSRRHRCYFRIVLKI